jgi:acyl-CoA thioester hydrolase
LDIKDSDAPRYLGVIVASTSCKYRSPLTYPDRISVAARVVHLDEQRFSMAYKVVSHKLGRVAAMGDALMVGFNLNELTPMDFPDAVRAKILKLEASAGNRVSDQIIEKTSS